MHKGVRIFITGIFNHPVLDKFLLSFTSKHDLQGSMQKATEEVEQSLTIFVVGDKDAIELLIDELYEEKNGLSINELDIKPLEEPKEFRGVFRIVENLSR